MFRVMDDIEIEIEQIQDIQMIHFYNLVADGDELPAVMVYYGDKKQINLSKLDKHYELLIEKIAGLYMVSPERITVDNQTEILLKEWSTEQRAEENRYTGGEKEPVFYPGSYMDYFVLPIVKYYVSQLYFLFDRKLVFRNTDFTWHGKGRIAGEVDGKELSFPVYISRTGEQEYHVFVGNFINNTSELELQIIYEKEGFRITLKASGIDLEGLCTFIIDIEQNKVVNQNSVTIDHKNIYEETVEVPVAGRELLQGLEQDGIRQVLPENTDNISFFVLPWKQYIGIDIRTEYTDTLNRKLIDIYYIFDLKKHDQVRRLSFRRLLGKSSGVTMDTHMHGFEVYVKKDTVNHIQVYYEPARVNSLGEYKKYLSNRYYYYEGRMETLI